MNSVKEVGQRAVKSVVALISRTLFLNIVNFAGALALTIFLSTKEFGIFIIASSAVDILTYFSDIGLAGALIQKKEELKKEEIEATFTIQQLLVLLCISLALLAAKLLQNIYGLDTDGMRLFYALLVAFFLASLKTIPSVLLERKLEFDKIIIPQIAETIVFNGLIVFLAWKGWGINSYVVAVLARAVVGLVIIYVLVRWKPRIRFSLEAIKSLLHFGIPYQVTSILAVFKDRVSLLILGKILGLEALGILGWAEKWANLALRYFLDSAVKVAFPMFSRLQSETEKVRQSLERSIYFISVLVFPILAGSYLIMPQVVQVLPKYVKWMPGITTFNLFLLSAAIAAISTFLTNFLTAMGRVKAVVGLMVMWTGLTLVLYPVLATKYSHQGVALGSVLIALTAVIPYLLVKRVVKFNLVKNIAPALVSSLVMILGVKAISSLVPISWKGLTVNVGFGFLCYGSSILILNGRKLISNIKTFTSYAKA